MSAAAPPSSDALTLTVVLVPVTGLGLAAAGVVIVGAAFGLAIVKFAADTPEGVPPELCLTRMRLVVLGTFGTVIVSLPSFAVLRTSEDQVPPPSVDRSMSTFPATPLLVQVTAVPPPTVHVSPPFGVIMLIDGAVTVTLALPLVEPFAAVTI